MTPFTRKAALLISTLILSGLLPATITFVPAAPGPGQTVTFTLVPVSPYLAVDSRITWTFGDGAGDLQPVTQLTTTHAYATAGTYTITARYYYTGGVGSVQTATETTVLTVEKTSRRIVFSPARPNTCETIHFEALGFSTLNAAPVIRWEFSDGTVLAGATTEVDHAFVAAGSYVVEAFGRNGIDPSSARATVTVTSKRSISVLTAQPKANT
ncbi:MAG TPA: PKD domain-containing protein, partial [Candidatus Aminicenantes bacterium]|nr:PKD domain-containing protein [Candidatus Aminicenantes bacterium]